MHESGYKTTKMENMQLIFAAKCVHNLESTLKEYSILTLIWVGFLGVRFEVGRMGGKITDYASGMQIGHKSEKRQ